MEVSYSVNGRPATDAKSLRAGRNIGGIFVVVGALLLVVAAVGWWRERSFLAHAEHARGLVVAMTGRVGGGSSRGTTYAPTFTFADRHGGEHRVTSPSGTNPPAYRVGENVDVFYAAARPDEAQLSGFFSQWGVPLIVGGIGAVQLLVGAALAFLFGRQARRIEGTGASEKSDA